MSEGLESPDWIEEGATAPDFTLKADDGKEVRLSAFRGKPVVLYFYPKDDTPGCTKEACGFRDSLRAIEQANTVVLGVSMDDAEAHQKFIKKYSLPFTLLCDEDGKVSKAYGVYKKKNMYGKTYWGIERSTFIIDETGKLKAIFRKVKVDGHVGEVQAALKA
jgi:thioredoxin-dependent peroxiredoxin